MSYTDKEMLAVMVAPVRADLERVRSQMPTPKQLEYLALMAEGYTDREIGRIVGRSYHTIRTQTQLVCQRMHCRSRTQAVAKCIREGWME